MMVSDAMVDLADCVMYASCVGNGMDVSEWCDVHGRGDVEPCVPPEVLECYAGHAAAGDDPVAAGEVAQRASALKEEWRRRYIVASAAWGNPGDEEADAL